jgi:spermidine synthase
MNRKGFLLGLYSTGGQVLLLRELVAALNGDELFLGTALFGWLLWVAAGAYLGGRSRFVVTSRTLFFAGAALLPLAIIAARLSPLLLSNIVGEVVPFTKAALVSIIVMLPVGAVSGWLFPTIARERGRLASSLVQVYLFEGVGAAVGGVIILLCVGSLFSTLGMSIIVGLVVLAGSLLSFDRHRRLVDLCIVAATLALLGATLASIPHLDNYLESAKYPSYQVVESFDTHYGHQVILSRDNALCLISDNAVEAAYPDVQTAENLLLPALVYKPAAHEILFIGRCEFGVAQLAGALPGVMLTAVDPRRALTTALDRILPLPTTVTRIDDDPMAFVARIQESQKYDIIVINAGDPDNYKRSRLLTSRFLVAAKSLLASDGLICVPTHYDTDGNISTDESELLSIIGNVLNETFTHVTYWPGYMTLFFAADGMPLDVPYDSIATRTSRLAYVPQFVNDNYLFDRLSQFKVDRLRDAVGRFDRHNSIEQPTLPYYQASYRAKASATDRTIMSMILRKPAWIIAIPLLIAGLFVATTVWRGERKRRFGLFLYFVAGLVSLTLEQVSFYVYQSAAGSLYSEIAALIGAFMLGLAAGAYFTTTWARRGAEYGATAMLLASSLLFFLTYRSVPASGLLLYHVCFLLSVAIATGSLFVAATQRYYPPGKDHNLGSGYACELVGSSLGALFPMTILLPVIGLHWLLFAVLSATALALVGSLVTCRGK